MAAKYTLFPILLTANFNNFKFGKLSKIYNNDSRYSNTNGSTCFENSLLCLWNIFFLISQNFVLRKMMRLPIAGVDWHSTRLEVRSRSQNIFAEAGAELYQVDCCSYFLTKKPLQFKYFSQTQLTTWDKLFLTFIYIYFIQAFETNDDN